MSGIQTYLELQKLEKDTRGSTTRDTAAKLVKAQMVGLGLGTFFHFLVASCHVSFEHIQSLDSVLVPLGVAGRQVASLCLAFVVLFVLRKQLIDESERKGRSRATIGTCKYIDTKNNKLKMNIRYTSNNTISQTLTY